MVQYIAVNQKVCTGCRECEVVCSLYRFGECNPERSAIRVLRKESKGLVWCLPLVCQQCEQPPCIDICPVDALSKDGDLGILNIDRESCTGCGECTTACPAGCIFMDTKEEVALACDLCGGEPQCIALCHSRCLTAGGKNSEPGERRVERLAEIADQEFQTVGAAGQGGLT